MRVIDVDGHIIEPEIMFREIGEEFLRRLQRLLDHRGQNLSDYGR